MSLRQVQHRLEIATAGRGLVEITPAVMRWAEAQGMAEGLLTAFCQHTSASLLAQENADPDVRADLERFFAVLAPEAAGRYVHDAEGPDDMPAHIKAALTQSSLSIPLLDGALGLGTWQGIYLWEHRHGPHRRELIVQVLGA